MDHAAFSHASVEVPGGGGGAALAFGQHAVAHAETGSAGRIGHTESRIHEDLNQTFRERLAVNLRCRR